MNILQILNDSYTATTQKLSVIGKIMVDTIVESIAIAEDVVDDLDVVRQASNEDAGYIPKEHTAQDVKNQAAFVVNVFAAGNFMFNTCRNPAETSISASIGFVNNVSSLTGVGLPDAMNKLNVPLYARSAVTYGSHASLLTGNNTFFNTIDNSIKELDVATNIVKNISSAI